MTANLDSALNSASKVLETRLSKASPLFLDAKFNVVSDEKYKGKIETIVEWMQEHNWAVHLPQVFQTVERLRITICIIYKEDPLCKKCWSSSRYPFFGGKSLQNQMTIRLFSKCNFPTFMQEKFFSKSLRKKPKTDGLSVSQMKIEKNQIFILLGFALDKEERSIPAIIVELRAKL
ncbi:MAG: hypothetical protein H7A42_09790 [Chlamydiales bacterium]|nr:hypothetical protein [Chlamydiales bacterium]MCP5491381.1 hypothetical protein [Chlamydiales bacterium]